MHSLPAAELITCSSFRLVPLRSAFNDANAINVKLRAAPARRKFEITIVPFRKRAQKSRLTERQTGNRDSVFSRLNYGQGREIISADSEMVKVGPLCVLG